MGGGKSGVRKGIPPVLRENHAYFLVVEHKRGAYGPPGEKRDSRKEDLK